jgi:hypothetical protein
LTIKFGQDKKSAAYSIVKDLFLSIHLPETGKIFSLLVELTGIEPATSGVQNRRSPD